MIIIHKHDNYISQIQITKYDSYKWKINFFDKTLEWNVQNAATPNEQRVAMYSSKEK